MSSIASPRDSSVSGRRGATPTTSSRPSLDLPLPRLAEASSSLHADAPAAPPKRSRAALREYYKLRSAAAAVAKGEDLSQANDAASEASSIHDFPLYEASELDQENFDTEEYVRRILKRQNLMELLATYNSVLGDIRALDAERKALVYDNYSKLISATETIEKMRKSMETGEPVACTLDVVIDEIYTKAEKMKKNMSEAFDGAEHQWAEQEAKMAKAKAAARNILEIPERVRNLVSEGNHEEAKLIWERARAILQRWKDREVGGSDVIECMEDGDAALRGEPPNEKSWVKIKNARVQ
ncbi:hypothetical protein K3495_g7916 [Podosphaera aphanis]|nr:hypothetical protein K3495_g7916 [Podosphaera aphanis]